MRSSRRFKTVGGDDLVIDVRPRRGNRRLSLAEAVADHRVTIIIEIIEHAAGR